MVEFLKKLLSFLPPKTRNKLYLLSWGYRLLGREQSYLVENGYVNSYLNKLPLTKDNLPLPWMNYSIINLLSERLNDSINLFEFGSGYSSLFFANKCKTITSLEYDTDWHTKIKDLITKHNILNLNLLFNQLDDSYPEVITKTNQKFEVIIVDGRKRVECSTNSLNYLMPNGVLLLDDSNRPEYESVFNLYHSCGFKSLTFKGLKPTGFTSAQTTIFYKTINCLEI